VLRRTEDRGIVELRLDRPPVNALSPDLVAALRREIGAACRDGAEGLLLSGAPGTFSAGLDVPLLLGLAREEIRAAWRGLFDLMRDLATSPLPVAAAITGHSPAGGAVLALFCDRRFMAGGDFRIGLNEVRVGIPMPLPILRGLRRLVGSRRADWLAVEGRMIGPEEALAAGLVDEVVPPERVVERARDWLRELLALPREAMLRTRAAARSDLVEALGPMDDREVDNVVDDWFADGTQRVLRELARRLGKGA
jgi:enoyl-CoA hydratase/carnithine racemase